MNKLLYAALILAGSLAFSSCQKSISDEPGNPTDTTTTPPSMSDLLKDSIYLFTKEVYLWHEVLPSYDVFNPRQFKAATDLEAAQNEMDALRAYEPNDRYSFVTTKEESDGLQTGSDKDLGFNILPAYADLVAPLDSVRWYVEYVYKNSPAGKAGIQRSWYINKINGTQISNDKASIDILNEIFFGATTSASFEFIAPGDSIANINLSKSSYIANSVLYQSVLSDGTNKVGYFVFNQFFGQPSRDELANVFNFFQSSGITDLVVDLRYNHGGSTETQDTLANLIAPLAANNQKMYQYIYNDSLQAGNFPLLKLKGFPDDNTLFKPENWTVTYEKAGSLNLPRVFFIVSRESASASELLINNLRPYMDVKLVGDTTYGKPVGFFPIDIYDYSIYPISFKTVNSAGSADYYDGFAPDKLMADGIWYNWGDTQEYCLATALNYISTGSFGRKANLSDAKTRQMYSLQKQLEPGRKKIAQNKFSGMFVEKNIK